MHPDARRQRHCTLVERRDESSYTTLPSLVQKVEQSVGRVAARASQSRLVMAALTRAEKE